MALVSCLVVVGAAVLLSVVCCLLFAVCCLLAVVSCLLSVVCCLLSVVCCLLFADCCLLSVVRCLLSAVCCLLSAVCCLLSVVCCLLFVVRCSLFAVRCSLFVVCCQLLLSVHYLFVVCSPSVHFHFACISLFVLSRFTVCVCLSLWSLSLCRQLFASCMPAAVGRKIKYRFPAWQAPEVFSERHPLIFSHYLCLCGSFFSSRICGIYVCSPSVFLPSALLKVPGETAILHHLLEFVISRPAPGVSLASPARNPIRKVPGETAFLHHLLEFVIIRPAPGVSLASPIRDARPKGAGERAVYPSPS